MLTAIKFDSVKKSYASNTALKGVSFSAESGKVLGILGRNGSGKTTIINLLVGLLSSDEGSVEMFGQSPPYNAKTRASMGLAPQKIALYENLTVTENLVLFATLQGLKDSEKKSKIATVSKRMGLNDFMHYKVKACSEGMKRRANIAVAMLADAELLLLDEPTAGVDIQSRQHILELVLELKKLGKTVIYTTHYIEEAEQVCDQVLILHEGRALACAEVDELVSQYGGDSQIQYRPSENEGVVSLSSNQPAQTIYELFGANRSISSLKVIPPSLQDVLRNLVSGDKVNA